MSDGDQSIFDARNKMHERGIVIEPTTLTGYCDDLEKWGCELLEDEDGEFSVMNRNGAVTKLENTSRFAAAFEAWHLMKP